MHGPLLRLNLVWVPIFEGKAKTSILENNTRLSCNNTATKTLKETVDKRTSVAVSINNGDVNSVAEVS